MAKRIIIGVEQTFSMYNTDNDLITRIKCVKDIQYTNCNACIFNDTNTCDNMVCNGIIRPDGLNVHFEYIES